MGYRRSVLQTVTKAPLLACVVLDIDWNTPIPLQTQARTLVDEQATFTGIKESFDPLNIAKKMTGGSKLAPALKLLNCWRKIAEISSGLISTIKLVFIC